MPLNATQFNQMAALANATGGYSISPSGSGASLKKVTDKYMVGGLTPTKIVDAPAQGSHVFDHYKENAQILQDPKAVMGAWANRDDNTVELDVSEGYDRTKEGGQAARRATVARDEIAYGEVDSAGEYVGEHANPFSERKMGRSGDPAQDADYLSKKASKQRAAHFRAGISSEALSVMLSGGTREEGKEAWIRSGPPSDQPR